MIDEVAASAVYFELRAQSKLDGWIVFGGLDRATILKVVDKEVGLLQQQLNEKKVTLVLTAAQLVRRLIALIPPARFHLTSFH